MNRRTKKNRGRTKRVKQENIYLLMVSVTANKCQKRVFCLDRV